LNEETVATATAGTVTVLALVAALTAGLVFASGGTPQPQPVDAPVVPALTAPRQPDTVAQLQTPLLTDPLRSVLTPAVPTPAAPAADPGSIEPAPERPAETGRITYYGKRFAGRKTASGERFDPEAMTMAHRTLPFGTRVRVTNLRNGESVILRVNDRMPPGKGRIADVSEGAARRLGMIEAGVVEARLEVLRVMRTR
jgi:rare lipoprotein A